MQHRPALALLALLAAVAFPAQAARVYKCVDAAGHIAYQDHPCSEGQRQQAVEIDERVPPPPPPTATPAPAPSPAIHPADTAPAVQATPAPPPPRRYACVRATDGKPYLSSHGNPQPYLAPFGMLGMFQQPLAETYGGRDAPRNASSDPALAQGRISSTLIGNNYVWVQDDCHLLSTAQTCAALRDEYDSNHRTLRNAFRSDRPPLEQREDELRQQLAGCGG